MIRRQIRIIAGCLLALVILFSITNAQSKRIDNATPLTSNEISGIIDENTKDDTFYYYSFWANPGEVKISVAVERNKNIDNTITLASVEFILYDSNSEVLAKKSASTSSVEDSQPASVTKVQVSITKRQNLVLGIKLPGGRYFGGIGKFKIRIDGADVKSNNNSSDKFGDDFGSVPTELHFPEKGAFFIKLNNQSGTVNIDTRLIEDISISSYPANQLKTSELNYGKINLPSAGRLSIRLKDKFSVIGLDLAQIYSIEINQIR